MDLKQYAFKKILLLTVLICMYNPGASRAYSILTHEAIIDVSWENSIKPLLLKKYPGATTSELLKAQSYAYGGSIIPDIGYYPFGSKLFTNLVHNVRSGDFVIALIEEALNLNEYAFALGALSHYTADNDGHSLATNRVVPLMFPKVKSKYGDIVTYADHKKSHSRVEFGFDLLQTARGNYASKAYHDFIGFNVSRTLMEKAFLKTYGLNLDEVFGSMSVATASFRLSVKTLFPTVVRAAWINKKRDIRKNTPEATSRSFSYRLKKYTYYHEFGWDHEKAGFTPIVISVILPLLPKIGPLSKYRYKRLSTEAEKLFIQSFDTTLVHYAVSLKKLHTEPLILANRTLDTGYNTASGDYSIVDAYYDHFLLKLKARNFDHLTPELKNNLLSFYSKAKAPLSGSLKKWNEVTEALELLRNAPVTAVSTYSLN